VRQHEYNLRFHRPDPQRTLHIGPLLSLPNRRGKGGPHRRRRGERRGGYGLLGAPARPHLIRERCPQRVAWLSVLARHAVFGNTAASPLSGKVFERGVKDSAGALCGVYPAFPPGLS